MEQPKKPKFDPNKAYEEVKVEKPAFNPDLPFDEVKKKAPSTSIVQKKESVLEPISGSLGGQNTEIKKFTGLSNTDLKNIESGNKPVPEINKKLKTYIESTSAKKQRKAELEDELSDTTVTVENQIDISKKTDELSKINKELQEAKDKSQERILQKQNYSKISSLTNKFLTGSSQLGVDLSAIPEFTYDLFSMPQNAIADIFDAPSLRTDSEKFKKTIGVNNQVKDYYKNEVLKLREQAQKTDLKYANGIYDSFVNGDYSGGFDQLTNSFAESIPVTTSVMVGGAYTKAPQLMAASSMMFGAGKNEKLKDENPEMSTNTRVTNALATGFIQGATETLGTGSIGAAAKGLVEREGAKKATTILKDGLVNYYKTALERNPIISSMSGEGLEEAFQGIAENAVDVATGVKPADYNIYQNAVDDFIGGSFGGAVFGAGLKGIQQVTNYQDQNQIKANTKKVFSLQNELQNPDLSPESKAEIDKNIDHLINVNQKLVQKNVDHVESLTPKLKEELMKSISTTETIKEKANQIKNDYNTSTETKKILLDNLYTEYSKANDLKNKILEGSVSEVEMLPLKEQDKIKREALKQLTEELNPEGKKNIEITNEQITERANKNYLNQIKDVKKSEIIPVESSETKSQTEIQKPTNETQEVKEVTPSGIEENKKIEYINGKGDKSILNTKDIQVSEDGKKFLFTESGNRIGHIQLKNPEGNEVSVSLSGIFNPSLERKGIGTIMYKKVAEILKDKYNLDLVSDKQRSKDSEALWAKLEREGNAVVIGDKSKGNINDYQYKYVHKNLPETDVSQDSLLKKELKRIGVPKNVIDAIPDDVELKRRFIIKIGNSILGPAGLHTIDLNEKESKNTIEISELANLFSKSAKDKTLFHEAVHAASVLAYDSIEKNEKYFTKEQFESHKELKKIIQNHIKNASFIDKELHYGLTNDYEFIAEFVSNPKFREYIGKTSEYKDKNIVKRIWKNILGMLGISKTDQSKIDNISSKMDKLFEFSKDLIPSYNEYVQKNKKTESQGQINEKTSESNIANDERIGSGTKPVDEVRATEQENIVEKPVSKTLKPRASETKVEVTEEEPKTALKNADIAKKRKELGLEEREKVTRKKGDELIDTATKKIKEGYDVENLIEDILDPKSSKTLNDEEVVILKQYQLAKENRLVEIGEEIVSATNEGSSSAKLDKLIQEREYLVDDIDKAYRAGEQSGTVTARALQARRLAMLQDYSLANMLIQKRKAIGDQKLTPEQIKETTDDYAKIQKLKSQLEEKILSLEKENADLKAGKNIEGLTREERKSKRKVKIEEIDSDIDATIESLRKKLREQAGRLSANAIPIEMIPDIAKLAQLYVKKGIVKLDDIVDGIYTSLKEDIDNLSKDDIKEIIADYDYKLEEKNQKRLDSLKKRTIDKIKELKDRLSKQDFEKKQTTPVQLDKEAKQLKEELRKAKFEWEKALEKDILDRRTELQKYRDYAAEVLSLPRSIMASIDFSAPLRQGLVLTVNNPATASKAFVEMFKQAFSQNRFDTWLEDLKETPQYQVMKDSGLYIADTHSAKLSAKEEQFMSNLANKIPIIGKGFEATVKGKKVKVGGLDLIGGSERAYVSYLNKLRTDVFAKTAKVFEDSKEGYTFENNPELYKALGNYINSATGRGNLGKFNDSSTILNSLFFSPRLIASRINLLTNWANPVWYENTPAKVRQMYALDMARFIGAGVALLSLASLGGADVEEDPRSSDFGKIRNGDTRWDIWGGFQQFARFFAQMLTGQRKNTNTKQIKDLDGTGFNSETRADVFLNMIRSKLAPVPGTLWNLSSGKTMVGEEYGLKDVPKSFLPLFASDLYKAMERDGAYKGVLETGIPAVFGVGVQTYPQKESSSNEKGFGPKLPSSPKPPTPK